MNGHLNSLEKWLTELDVKNVARPTCLMVNKAQLLALVGAEADVVPTLKSINTKLFISQQDNEWLYVDSF
jgi:hypothetical protein